ncbi:MAG: cysteine desulfurase family protein [Silvanigrellaceae bacterium]
MSSAGMPLAKISPFAHHFDSQLGRLAKPQDIHFGGVELPAELIYLDHAAATPVDSRVLHKMLPWMTQIYGNPANRLHPMGELAEHGLASARQLIAQSIGVDFDEVTFCASATEANNLLLRGLAQNPLRKRNKIVVCATEHSSILATASEMDTSGIEIAHLKVDANGQINLNQAEEIIDGNTLCVCAMDVNNETGIIQSHLGDVIAIAHRQGALIHVDAVQGFARGNFSSNTCDFDSATISGAKIYAGRGAAALILKKRTPRIRISPQLTGGGHEAGLRSGTPHLSAIVGFAEAARLQVEERSERLHHLAHLESIFLRSLGGMIDFAGAGSAARKCPGIVMIHIPGVNAMKLIENMKHLCISTGSACRTLQATTSHVLTAMGMEDDAALSSFRVSIGLTNNEAEMLSAASLIAETALELRKSSANLPR